MLVEIEKVVGRSIVPINWISAMKTLGDLVALYRDYEDGRHRDRLTASQRKQLGVSENQLLSQFNINYCPLIIGKMADRLRVVAIDVRVEGTGDNKAQEWLDSVMQFNRFDALQVSIHEAAIRDGASYLMVSYDADEKKTVWTDEPAYDTRTGTGMIVVYDGTGSRIVAAVKIWKEPFPLIEEDVSGTDGVSTTVDGITRVNVYRAAVTEKYISSGDGGAFVPFTDDDTDELGIVFNTDNRAENGKPLGIPVFQFANNKKRLRIFGQSELHNAIPLQDASNWALIDLKMTSRLTAFPRIVAKGWDPGDIETGPGEFLIYGDTDGDKERLDAMDCYILESGELMPFLDEIDKIADKISEITRTPLASSMGSSMQSGEALKERQHGLVEKVQRGQTLFGNVWEDVGGYSLMLHDTFGGVSLPEIKAIDTRWTPAALRNDADIINAANVMKAAGYEKEFLRLMGQLPYLGYDETKIKDLMEERFANAEREISLVNLPGVGGQRAS